MSGSSSVHAHRRRGILVPLVAACLLFLTALADAATLRGVVQGPDEAPLAGLEIQAQGQTATTDTEGRFQLEGLEAGRHILRVLGKEGAGQVAVVLDAEGQEVFLSYPVETTIIFLHDNDLHFNFNHRELFEERVEGYREQYENVFLMNAGDIFIRHPHRWNEEDDMEYYSRMAHFIIRNMNELAYDVCALGNHELDYIEDRTRAALDEAQFPLLSANATVTTEKLPPVKPYIILNTDNGYSIAVLGLSAVPGNKEGLEGADPIETAKAYTHLAEEHDLFIALNHIGVSRDRELAEAVPELDLIIGGHSHTLLEEAEMVNGVLVAQAGGPPPEHGQDPEWPKYLGVIRVVMKNGEVVEKSGHVQTLEGAAVAVAE